MLVHDAPILGLRRLPQIHYRTTEPAIGRLAKAQLRLRGDAVTASPPRGQVILDLRAARTPRFTVRQRWRPVSALKPTSSTPVDRRYIPRSTRTRRGVPVESGMAYTAHRDNRHWSRAAPCIEIRPAEEQLASDTRLLGRDRSLSRKTTQAVAANAEILGSAPSIEPLVRSLGSGGDKPRRGAIRHQVG